MAAELKPAYLLVGGDRPKIARALQRLKARIGEGGMETLSAGEASGDDAVAACNALGLLAGGGRLVLVEHVERWRSPDVEAVSAYLANPAPDTVLALTGEVKPDSALAKAVAKHGEVLVYDVAKRALPKWIGEQFARLDVQADEDARRALVELVGDDLEELATEIEKLATWAGGERVSARDVEQLVAGRADTSIFAVTDAWGRRDVAGVLAACEAILERSQRSRREEVPRLVGLLAGHVARVRTCQALAAEGVRAREAAAQLKLHPFAAEKAFAHAANYTVEELRDVVVRLAQLDEALKGASRLAADLELERALVDVTRPRATAETTAG